MPWECPRNGNRKPLDLELFESQMYHGAPMIDGPHGPEIDSDVEEEEVMDGGERGGLEMGVMRHGRGEGIAKGGDRGLDEGESEVLSSDGDEAPSKHKRETKGTKKGRKGKGKGKVKENSEWKALARKHCTPKEAVHLILSFSLISSQRHHQELLTLISMVCGRLGQSFDSISSTIPPPSANVGLEMLSTMASQVLGLIQQAQMLDFCRMVSLMQLALWLDWYVFMYYHLHLYADALCQASSICS